MQFLDPGPGGTTSEDATPWETEHTLVASMIWARLLSWVKDDRDGIPQVQDPNGLKLGSAYWKDGSTIRTVRSAVTLKRNGLLLLLVLAI